MELFKFLFIISLSYIAESASIIKSIDNSDDVQVAVPPATYVGEEIKQNSGKENNAIQEDVPKEGQELLEDIEKEITKIQKNNIELRASKQNNGEIHIPVAIIETPISSPTSAVQPEVATSNDVQGTTRQSDVQVQSGPPAQPSDPLPPPAVQQDTTPQNIFQQIYAGVTNAFQNSIQSLATSISGFFGNGGTRSPSSEDNAIIEQGLKKLQGTLQQGLNRLNKTYEAYVELNNKNKPEETSSQDVAESQLLQNQLHVLQQQIVDGTRDVEESIQSINSVGKAEETTLAPSAPSNPGGIFQQAISNFQHGVQQSLQNINSTFQGFINRGQGDAASTAETGTATVRPPGIIQQGLQNLQQGFQQGFQSFQNLVRPQQVQSEETSSNRPNIFQQGFQNLQQGFQNLINRPVSQPATAEATTGAKENAVIQETAEKSPEQQAPVQEPEKQEQDDDINADKAKENVNEPPVAKEEK